MKKINCIRFFMLSLAVFLFHRGALAAASRNDSAAGVEISARIFEIIPQQGEYKIELFVAGTFIDSEVLGTNEYFSFVLQKGKRYALRISKNNTVIRQISLHSGHPEKDYNQGLFDFHTDLSFDNDPETEGFPIGILSLKGKLRSGADGEELRAKLRKGPQVAKK
jgi:hypothetical protein